MFSSEESGILGLRNMGNLLSVQWLKLQTVEFVFVGKRQHIIMFYA